MPCGAHYIADWSQCVGHRPACPSNRFYGGGIPVPGGKVTSAQIEALRATVADEVNQWRAHRYYTTLPVYNSPLTGPGGRADASAVRAIDEMIHHGGAAHPNAGNIIDDALFQQLVNEYNGVAYFRDDCICDSDCGCNTVCVCNLDCVCNYSDRRLKYEVQYC